MWSFEGGNVIVAGSPVSDFDAVASGTYSDVLPRYCSVILTLGW